MKKHPGFPPLWGGRVLCLPLLWVQPRAAKYSQNQNEQACKLWLAHSSGIFFFFLSFLLYFPSKQEPAPSLLHNRGTLRDTISSPQLPGFPGNTHRAGTGKWLQNASKILPPRASFSCVLTVGRALCGPGNTLAMPTLCSQTLVERGCSLAHALGIFLERS